MNLMTIGPTECGMETSLLKMQQWVTTVAILNNSVLHVINSIHSQRLQVELVKTHSASLVSCFQNLLQSSHFEPVTSTQLLTIKQLLMNLQELFYQLGFCLA
jgi:hypothetical protein